VRRQTAIIIAVIAVVLLPMWYVALHGEPPSEEIEIDPTVSDIRPLGDIIDTPEKLSPSQVGVIVWIALFALIAVLTGAHRFMNEAVRPPNEGGHGTPTLPFLETADRWIVEYHEASMERDGIIAMGALTVLAIVFAALFTGEYLTLARTQYFGVYAAGLFLSLSALTVAYYAWFMPHIEVAEERGH